MLFDPEADTLYVYPGAEFRKILPFDTKQFYTSHDFIRKKNPET